MTAKQKRSLLRQQTKEKCELATAFVNLRHDIGMKKFMDDHRGNLRSWPKKYLLELARVLRELWDTAKRETAEYNLEQIFAAPPEAEMAPGEIRRITAFEKAFQHPAFRIRLGKDSPRFEPRDVLDEIAYAIVHAAENNLLKTCEGSLRGWPCPTPKLVADEGRRRFCYGSCGDQAKAEAKRKSERRKKREA